MNELKEQLRVSLLAQSELRALVEQKESELAGIREFSEVEREAMQEEREGLLKEAEAMREEREGLLNEADCQVGGVKALAKGLQEEKSEMAVQIQFLESALESAAADRANVEAKAESSGTAKLQENVTLQKEIEFLKKSLTVSQDQRNQAETLCLKANKAPVTGAGCGAADSSSCSGGDGGGGGADKEENRRIMQQASRQVTIMDMLI
jgi:hypothetical protein